MIKEASLQDSKREKEREWGDGENTSVYVQTINYDQICRVKNNWTRKKMATMPHRRLKMIYIRIGMTTVSFSFPRASLFHNTCVSMVSSSFDWFSIGINVRSFHQMNVFQVFLLSKTSIKTRKIELIGCCFSFVCVPKSITR